MFCIRLHSIFRWGAAAGAACLMCLAPAPRSEAGIITFTADTANSTEGLGDFTGTIEYTPLSTSSGSLIITLTNTSDPANGGFITGFLFNIDSADPAASASLTSTTHSAFLGIANQNASPFGGPFTAGAALSGNWEGGGRPSEGIAVGDTGTFAFDVAAADASSLSAISFIEGPSDFNFVVRLRGFDDGGSDKVPAMLVPTPASLGLLLVAGVVGLSRRRSAQRTGL